MRKCLVITFIVLAVGAPFILALQKGFATSQGSLGPDSEGSATILMSIPQLVRISGLQDIDFGTYSGGSDMSEDRDLCVYTNLESGNYQVEAKGNGTEDAFELKREEGVGIVPYAVYWKDLPAGSQLELKTGEARAFSSANTDSQNCSGGTNNSANLEVRLKASDLLNVFAGDYSGVLSITILPEP